MAQTQTQNDFLVVDIFFLPRLIREENFRFSDAGYSLIIE